MPYIDTTPCYENTVMKEIRNNENVLTGYDIGPVDGYVIHNRALDEYEYDHETFEEKELIRRGFSPSSCSVGSEYDFDTNPDEIYAIKRDAVGENDGIY